MKRVLKFEMPIKPGRFMLRLPRGAKVVAFEWQKSSGRLCLWAECEHGGYWNCAFRLFGTGEWIPGDEETYRHIGTALLHGDGSEVVHLYEVLDG
jgi:hypothetical protein